MGILEQESGYYKKSKSKDKSSKGTNTSSKMSFREAFSWQPPRNKKGMPSSRSEEYRERDIAASKVIGESLKMSKLRQKEKQASTLARREKYKKLIYLKQKFDQLARAEKRVEEVGKGTYDALAKRVSRHKRKRVLDRW